MSFAFEIKKEILEKKFDSLYAESFISGLISTSIKYQISNYIIKKNNSKISNLIKKIMNNLKLKFESSKKNKNWIILNNYFLSLEISQPSYFFAGVFVGGGSISNIDSTFYHLEIQFYSHFQATRIKEFLNKYNFSFSLIKRRELYVLYLKKSDQISDFLKAIQTFKSLLKFENARIKRDLHSQLNRYSNLDSYNQKKLAISSNKFKKQYEYIKKNNLFINFNKNEILFFQLKLKNPYSSLEELRKIFENKTGLVKSKSCFNHWIIKLRKIYNNL